MITGGAGFIGSHLADQLSARGDELLLLDDLSTGRRENVAHLLDAGKVELVEGSAGDSDLVGELMLVCDTCFHLASSVGVKLIVDRPLESVLRTVRANEVVMEAAASLAKPLLFTSTSEVYGIGTGGPLREADNRLVGAPTKSRWSYSTAKVLGEILAYGYVREHGARMTVARLFNSVGPRQTGRYGMVMPRFVRQALEGRELEVYGTGEQSRCFTHVADTVEGLIGLAECEAASGNVYNVGADRAITIHELAKQVIDRTGSASRIRLVPYEEAYGDGFEELGSRTPDCAAIEGLIGWRPTRTIDDAIDDVIAHEREQLHLPGAGSEPAIGGRAH